MMNLIKRNTNRIPVFSIWDDLLNTDLPGRSVSKQMLPAVNILESADDFQIELAVPGMKKEDFKVEVEHDKLIISAEVENSKEEGEAGYTRREFRYRSFRRSFILPGEVAGDQIAASYKDGILKVTVPKRDEAKVKPSRLIEVA